MTPEKTNKKNKQTQKQLTIQTRKNPTKQIKQKIPLKQCVMLLNILSLKNVLHGH